MDGRDGVGFALGVGRDAKGLKVGCDVGKFEPVGFVGEGFVVEDQASWCIKLV